MGNYPEPGTTLLGKYLVESLIGEGGMGAVIKAKHIGLDEPVAIKCLLPEMMSRTDIVARFLREAKAAVKLKGEHVARVLDVGRMENNVPYIVMEYLDGADLNAIIKHYGAQDPAVAVDLMLQACEAIAEAHSLGIIHRDVKASNFFVTQPPNHPPVLKVLDFGIATAPEGASDLTSTQSVIGTPAYMAPEQMRSSRTADARSDIWAMGVVLYELLEGKRPFLSEVYSELCLKVGMDPPDPMRAPGVPEGLQTVVMKCLEKPIEQRYQSVAELAFDLLPFATDPVAGRAIVEQCARLLGRRSAKGYDHKTPRPSAGDATPAPFTPPQLTPSRLTPPMGVEIDVERTEMTPVSQSMVLGRPTPMPSGTPKTPTSIGSGVGEVSGMVPAIQEPKPRRRGAVIGAVALAVVAIVGVGVFALGGSSGAQSENTPAAAPAAAPSPTATETATPPAAPIAATPPPPLLVTPDPPPPTLPPPPDPKPPSTAASTPDPTPTPAPPTVKAVHPKTTQTSVGKTTHPKQTQTTAKSTKSDPGDIYTKRQ